MTEADDDHHRPAVLPGAVLPVTSARDGREHLVAEHLMTIGSAGRYPALCGHRVWAAVLACPSGPPCRDCLAVRNPRSSGHRRQRRTNRRRVWNRFAAWLTPSKPVHRARSR